MTASNEPTETIEALVESVLPVLGLAYVADGEHRWGVTRATLGGGFDALAPGLRVRLRLQSHRGSTLVKDCKPAAGPAPGH